MKHYHHFLLNLILYKFDNLTIFIINVKFFFTLIFGIQTDVHLHLAGHLGIGNNIDRFFEDILENSNIVSTLIRQAIEKIKET